MANIPQSNSKRLVKNTAFMYARMIFLMAISLYTSRVILQQLGVDDYGIYNVVGSIVAMFVSLKAMFAGSTQRFLNYEMGSGHPENLHTVFNTSAVINLLIGIIFVILAESVGLWFLKFKINIDPSRLIAAHWVLQFSILTTFITIICIPLDACVIAHERMDFYAFLSIFEGLAKLGICYMLTIWNVDKLIMYGLLMMMVSVFVGIINCFFCRHNFSECYLTRTLNKEYFVKMSKFAGWAFFGNTSNAISNNGLNMVLNVFGGPVVNAARGISQQVSGAISQLLSNITIVVKPYVVKTYAGGDREKAIYFSMLSSRIYYIIQLILVTCITFFTEKILMLWLGVIPEYTVVFLSLVMIQSLIRCLQLPINMLFSGNGDIKAYEIAEGVILFLPVPISYVLLHFGLPYYSAFIVLIIVEIVHIITISFICNRVCGLPLAKYLKRVILPCVVCFALYSFFYVLNIRYAATLFTSICIAGVSILTFVLYMFFCGFSKNERLLFLNLIQKIKNDNNK